jgi:hypothetical protein
VPETLPPSGRIEESLLRTRYFWDHDSKVATELPPFEGLNTRYPLQTAA